MFNGATWNSKDLKSMMDKKLTGSNEMLLLLKESLIKDKVDKRTEKQWNTIYAKRRLAKIISIVILIFGWSLIWLGSYYENQIQDFFLNEFGNAFFGEWSSTLVMTIVNYLIPWMISKVSYLENWDFASEELYTDLWKNYFTTMLNIIFFLAIQVSDYLGTQMQQPDTSYSCKEDGVTDNLIKLLVSEGILRYAYYIYWFFHHSIKS